ncbi:hypothetical protein MtrunA17_Chr3g0103341 [Medicago truncatula]|uniref:Transmembrane protein, putative n=1 Tax=Medicago truncatula TaxID=3880 RepID=A0A072UXF7_MEDTR|nr:uncharacterized protein LOC25490748 [Medicago truncatula]KEH34126.1 transmembrane protein, putative [Medicago truncatula]RHN67497.1 hypothetical protein MtrunA17_Chr3g0103341 [Medicago truncatula]
MAETNNTHHIVEIPVDQEHHENNNNNKALLCSNMFDAIDDHPLTEISESPGHLLLLKLWQREENLFAKRISRKETRMDSIKSELFQLTSFFFIFHGFFLTLLFTSWQKTQMNGGSGGSCKIWWIPSLISLSTSLVFVFLVQVKLVRYWKVWERLQRERNDSRGVGRCIQELRMKGASFDLSKELQVNGKRMKSSSVEIKWKVVTWFNRYLLTVSLVCFTGLAFPASKFVLCGL